MNTTPGIENEERNEGDTGFYEKRNGNEDNEYSEYSDSFVEHLFNVNRKGSRRNRGKLYGQHLHLENEQENGNCNWYDAEGTPVRGTKPYTVRREQELYAAREDEEVMKYYSVVKSNKMNDDILQSQIDQLLNFNNRIETYEEKQKRLFLGSTNDEEIDPCLYSVEDDKEDKDSGDGYGHVHGAIFFSHFLDDLSRVKKYRLTERTIHLPPRSNKEEMNQHDEGNSSVPCDHLGGSEIIQLLNSQNITFNEKRLLNICNINLNNILYFYLCCNEEYGSLCMEGGGKLVYTYDSYSFEGPEGGSDVSSNSSSEGRTSRSSSISDEELLMLRYGNAEGSGYSEECGEEYDEEEAGWYGDEPFRRRRTQKRKKKRNAKRNRHGGKGATSTPSSAEPTKMNKEVESLMNKANTCYICQNFDECIRILEKVIKLAPSLHDPFHLLGLIHEREYKNVKKAINYYLIAAHLSRNDYLSWYNIIELCKIDKQYNLILYCLFKVLRIYRRKLSKREKKRIGGCVQNDVHYNENHHCSSAESMDTIPKEDNIHDDHLAQSKQNKHREMEKEQINDLDDFSKHLYFNIAFTYLLLEDYKKGLKWLLLMRNTCAGEIDPLVDLYVCICLVVVRNPQDSYHFLKHMFLRLVRKKRAQLSAASASGEKTPSRAAIWSYKEKSIVCFFMQSQILNGKYDECIFVYTILTAMSGEQIHLDIFIQFVRSLLMVGNVDYVYLNNCYFLQFLLGKEALFEDLIFHLAESYYSRGMFQSAIYFYHLIYARWKGVLGGENSAKGKERLSPNNAPSLCGTGSDTPISYDHGVHFLTTVYKLVKSYYYLQNFEKAEQIIVKILNNEHLEKNNIEIDIKTLYIDILHKTKRHKKAINILLSIKQKKLRFMCSIPNPLSNKEREILLMKILNRKNKLLLYLSHNNYIIHMFSVYQKKDSVFYKYDNFLSKRDVNDIIKLRANICFCYFCVKYNFSILGYLYLYNILIFLHSKGMGGCATRSACKNRGEYITGDTRNRILRQRIQSLHTYREYVVFLATSFHIFKNRKKPESLEIVHKDLKLAGTKLFYKGVFVFDVKKVLIQGDGAEGSGNMDANICASSDSLPTTTGSHRRVEAQFRRRLHRYAQGVESEIFSSKIVVKFYKFSYSFFYLLYEIEQDFKRIHTAMEKENINFKGREKDIKGREIEFETRGCRSLLLPPGHSNLYSDGSELPSCTVTRHVADPTHHQENPKGGMVQMAGERPKRSKRFSFLVTKKKMNFFTFENYLGLYFSLLFLEESFFIVTTMNMYEDAIHILSIYLKNRKSSKMKFLTYMKSIKREFQKRRISNHFINVQLYFFNNAYSSIIKDEMRMEYKNFFKMSEHVDCKYFLFRINLLLNRLYISSGKIEKQIKCLNDVYIFKGKEKDEYKVLKYYSDIVLTGTFCQNFLSSISKSRYKNILITFRLFLVRTLHSKNSNPFLIYLIGNVCNLSCMIVNSVHEYTRAYAFLLKSRRANRKRLLRWNQGVKGIKGVKGNSQPDGQSDGQPDDQSDDKSDDKSDDECGDQLDDREEELEEEHFLFTKLKVCAEGKKQNQVEDNFETVADDLNFLFSLMTSYFNYASGYRVQNRESVLMTSFCLLNDYITKRYQQKVLDKKIKYQKYSLFYKVYKYIYIAEILYNLGRALHHLSYFSECMKLYLSVIRLVQRADREMKKICSSNKLNLSRKFIFEHVINMNRCMCYTCLYFGHKEQGTPVQNLANYFNNLNSKYSNLFLLFFDKRHLLFSASYNLGVIFKKLNRFEQAKYVLRNIVWD
ncbi:conserved Plasmodium protein, unknown function [Plasmodium knowlesi strain H]|uniref:Tetratricopeptide repeat protein n=3 Tax=Plasmodium knowlesi TaxID=5850 RepID=A0A5K1V5K1_PLAKH|nr:conserved Plasmodium protein, unknown function [Plasmodium knowlesi strain H]OTN64384.1 Uncharacterized protein PKNOH_S130206700 [Plasmodium knowlesi]CAA9989228.1 conserved Plasmodium protein, unknown function [Plasmodium knowlesi strain H]SBO26214.1 conserved Plasmodium protein, unknown function [Plasmodium knowlesi strain H]SBO27154.1 conserved Plasmodium protein, unknown function [Plasmodium knowlesi strain H]VVS78702.1 conserved Plasmodium protein, unknown function [Plasmodium knowlesi |eukprot:XP_002261573.1 hypothetical protein, conserved in Plasmodium species [Plasmodium knowlesi strain H]